MYLLGLQDKGNYLLINPTRRVDCAGGISEVSSKQTLSCKENPADMIRPKFFQASFTTNLVINILISHLYDYRSCANLKLVTPFGEC